PRRHAHRGAAERRTIRVVRREDPLGDRAVAGDRRRDIRADARLTLRGYTVLRFDFQQVYFDWDYVEATVLAAVAQGRPRVAGPGIR
ncbi:MAG TPA: hypothetical protein VFX99_00635, partial [Microbacterium sp.]|nr:hypothetical protein [Microbacterium sp.]